MEEPPLKKIKMDPLDTPRDNDESCQEPYNSSQDMFADSTEEESDDNDGRF